MLTSHATRWVPIAGLVLTVATVSAAIVAAQNPNTQIHDAGWKIRAGMGYGSNAYSSSRSAGRSIQSAVDGCQGLYQYSYTAPVIAPPIVKRESEDVGKSITAARKDLGDVRKVTSMDKAVQAKLDAIEKHLAAAVDHHKMLHAECCKDQVDGPKSTECCSDLITELEKAQAEHRALMRMLNPPRIVASEKAKS